MLFAIGNSPANQDGSVIVDVDQEGVIIPQYPLSEQGCSLTIIDGVNTIIPGVDPLETWELGNIYIDGAKKRTLPNTIHAFGATMHNGSLFVATGGHAGDLETFRGYVLKSSDLGDTWSGVEVANYRAYDIISFNDLLYVIADNFQEPILIVSDDDGETWDLVTGVVPELSKVPKMIVWDNKLILLRHTHEIYSIDGAGIVLVYPSPGYVITPTFNMFAVNGTDLFVLCTDRIYQTSDLETWTWYCDLGRPCTGLAVWSGFGLIASEIGSDARLLRIPFV